MSKQSMDEKLTSLIKHENHISEKEKKLLPIICICSSLFAVILCVILGLSDATVLLIVFLAVAAISYGVAMAVFISRKKPEEISARDQLKNSVKYSDSDRVLTVTTKSKLLLEKLSLVQAVDQQVKTEPIVLHFGAVAVGGVVTGGTYTTGGNHYIAGQEKSECFKLMYCGNEVKYIKLSEALLESARKSEIKEYIDFGGIKVIAPINTATLSDAEKMRRLQEAKAGVVRAENVGYPTYEKAVAIVNWLTTENE